MEAQPSTSCFLAEAEYAQSLNSLTDDARPKPQVFVGKNCSISGMVWFTPTISITGKVGSFIVPKGGTLTFTSTTGLTKIINEQFSVTINDLSNLFYDTAETLTLYDNTAQITRSLGPITDNDWYISRCTGSDATTIGGIALTTYRPQSVACDRVMSNHCYTPQPDGTTKVDSTNPECGCFSDQESIYNNFCSGSSTGNCTDSTALAAFIPVKCFGASCTNGGYKTKQMSQQNCSLTLCEQLVDVVGEDNVLEHGATLYCGNRPYVTPTVTPTPDNSKPISVNPNSNWIYIFVGFVIFMIVIVSIITYAQFNQKTIELGANGQIV